MQILYIKTLHSKHFRSTMQDIQLWRNIKRNFTSNWKRCRMM